MLEELDKFLFKELLIKLLDLDFCENIVLYFLLEWKDGFLFDGFGYVCVVDCINFEFGL